MNTKEMIKVMQAYVDGKEIELRCSYRGSWSKTDDPQWDWSSCEYRVKQKPIVQWYVVDSIGNIHYQFDNRRRAEYIASTINTYRVVKMQEVKEE